ncbi:MAG: RNA polymerase sigma factor [bacterium]
MEQPPVHLEQRLLAGDPASFDDIVAWYAGDVLRLACLLLKNHEEAQDVLQEALIRLARVVKAGQFRARNGSIKGFLLTAARNLCIDRLKSRVWFQSLEEAPDPPSSQLDHLTPDRVMDEMRFQQAFEQALHRLTDTQRTILVLRDLQGESYVEIARSLNLTVNAVTTHLCRARRTLRRWLAPFGEMP